MLNPRSAVFPCCSTLVAVLFFTGATWVLGRGGRLDRQDGFILIGLFAFWQCFQVYDVRKHNVRRRTSFSALFYLDVGIVLVCAYGIYVSIDWLVTWLSQQHGGFVERQSSRLAQWLAHGPAQRAARLLLGLENAAPTSSTARRSATVIICIPLCLGLCCWCLRP